MEANPCQAVEEPSYTLNQPRSAIHSHLCHIGKVCRTGVWVPHNLPEPTDRRRNALPQRHRTYPSFEHLATGVEKWVSCDNSRREKQWLIPKELPRSIAKSTLPRKALLSVCWDIRGIVHFEVLKPGQTVHGNLYWESGSSEPSFSGKVTDDRQEKGPLTRQWKTALCKTDTGRIDELGGEVWPHPPYSSNLMFSDYYLFQSLQHFLSVKNMKIWRIFNILIGYFPEKPQHF